jgi:hypothetical protein
MKDNIRLLVTSGFMAVLTLMFALATISLLQLQSNVTKNINDSSATPASIESPGKNWSVSAWMKEKQRSITSCSS